MKTIALSSLVWLGLICHVYADCIDVETIARDGICPWGVWFKVNINMLYVNDQEDCERFDLELIGGAVESQVYYIFTVPVFYYTLDAVVVSDGTHRSWYSAEDGCYYQYWVRHTTTWCGEYLAVGYVPIINLGNRIESKERMGVWPPGWTPYEPCLWEPCIYDLNSYLHARNTWLSYVASH